VKRRDFLRAAGPTAGAPAVPRMAPTQGGIREEFFHRG
jgi:hypothetical protein